MTLWLEKSTVRTQIESMFHDEDVDFDVTRIADSPSGVEQLKVVFYTKELPSIPPRKLETLKRYLNALRDCNPELTVTTESGNLAFIIQADEEAYRAE